MSRALTILLLLSVLAGPASSQFTTVIDSTEPGFRTVIAGKEYKASALKRFLWGNDYRDEWATAIKVPVLDLDKMHGGLTPIELGGGRQTMTLHMKDASGRRWVLRSVNKTYSKALPEIAAGTFVETIANDQTATTRPYATITVPPMASAAGVYHANPVLYLVPHHPRLGKYDRIFGNMLCWLEERPDETQTEQKSFGYPKDIDGSEKMVENITGDNDFKVDQHHYVKTRLFDMFIGDWGRHIDNWRWAQFDEGKPDVYRAVPKDRDQTQAKFEGVLFNLIKMGAGLKELQSFDDKINDIFWHNYPAVEIDRRFSNEITRRIWIDSAKALQQSLTDAVIEEAVKKMPPEVFKIRGEETIRFLKIRRDDLAQYASDYYDFLSRVVEVPGTKKNEYFEVQRLNSEETVVRMYKITKEGEIKKEPLYSRVFYRRETEEIRLYGIGGNDRYTISGHVDEGITVRIIGGPNRDALRDSSSVNGTTHKTKYYDNMGNRIVPSLETKIRLSDTTYKYPFDEPFKFDYKGTKIFPGLNTFYRIYIGLSYTRRVHGWREKPYKAEHHFGVDYSLTEGSLHPFYRLRMPHIFSAWNFGFNIGFDGVRRVNFFGTGNETARQTDDDRYYFLRTRNFYTTTSLDRDFAKYHNIDFSLDYEIIKVLSQNGRYLDKNRNIVPLRTFDWNYFTGASAGYTLNKINDVIVPTSGIQFRTGIKHTINLQDRDRSFTNVMGNLHLYIPVFKAFSIHTNTGAATNTGNPEFYQHNSIGGSVTVRGYTRNRFYGKSTFYNQAEIRWIPHVKSYLFNGRMGLIALYDVGRVWQPGETSALWHRSYGGGLMIVPFNKISATVFYSVSKEDRLFNFKFGKFF